MAQYDVDIIVIGGGPGGYPAAIHAAKLGGKVVCIDFDNAGGTCLNWGCIPTKTMIGSVAALAQARHAADFGLTVGEVGFDMKAVMARKDSVVKTLVSGVEFLFKKNKVRFIKGRGKLIDPHTVEAETDDGKTERLTAASIILATGSVPMYIPIPGLDQAGAAGDVWVDNREVRNRKAAGVLADTVLWTSNEAVSAKEVPARLAIIGAAVVGTEFAYAYRGLGSDVTLIEILPQILPQIDSEIAGELRKLLEKSGIKILTGTKVVAVDLNARKLKYTSESGDGEVEFDKVLMAVGRRPFTDGLGLENAGVELNKKAISVDDFMRTNVPHIYAIGDAAGGGLAHVATREGEVAAENALGGSVKMDRRAIPACVYTEPEVAVTGLTEQEARDAGHDVKVGRFTFKSLGKALAINENVGLVKIVTDARYGEILGAHIVGPHATDLIHEICVSIKLESTIEELMHTIHAHPTLAEAVMEAAQDVKGASVHK
ncbi:MAG: dihydrolipoyl dehydrogenase [Capsulimonadaceae bacterium]